MKKEFIKCLLHSRRLFSGIKLLSQLRVKPGWVFVTLIALFSVMHGFAQTPPEWCGLESNFSVPSNTTVKISTLFPNTNLISGQVIEINTGGTLEIDKNFTFYFCFIRCGENASIVTSGTNTVFTAQYSKFYSCTEMWTGIVVNDNARIKFNTCNINDARTALYFPPGYNNATNDLRNNSFTNNFMAIRAGKFDIGGVLPGATVGFVRFYGNMFSQAGALLDAALLVAHSAAFVDNQSTLTFGTAGNNKNIAQNMQNGIVLRKNSYAVVANTEFKNMKKSQTNAQAGVGIYATNSGLTVTKAGSTTASGNCIFSDNPNAGIYMLNATSSTLIEYAQFSGAQAFGIRYENSLSMVQINIHHNDITLRRSNLYGIYFERPPGIIDLTNSAIKFNRITVPVNAGGECNLMSLMYVIGKTGALNKLEITDNRLQDFSNCANEHGIYVKGLVGDNYILRRDSVEYLYNGGINNLVQVLGIALEDVMGDGHEVVSNYVRSILTSKPQVGTEVNIRSNIKCGIHVANCNATQVCQNNVDNTYRGIHFGDYNPGTFFGSNQMHRHVYGVLFQKIGDQNTDIGTQIRRENIWSTNAGDYIDGGRGAKYSDGSVPFEFKYDPDFASLGHIPPSATPSIPTWFKPEDGEPQSCGAINIVITETDRLIARGEYQYNNAANGWDLRRQLHYKLIRHPELIDDDTDVQNFYYATINSSERKFANVLNRYEQAYITAANGNIASQLNNLYNLRDNLVREVLSQYSTLMDDSLDQNTATIQYLSTKMDQIQDVNESISELSEEYSAALNALLSIVETAIAALPDSQPYENSWITLLESAATTGQGEVLSTGKRDALIAIANSCPASVGVAWQAVLPFLPIEDAEPYLGREESPACPEERIDHTHVVPQEGNYILSPNPASRYLDVTLPDVKGYSWSVVSSSGRVVASDRVETGLSHFSYDVSQLNAGLYLLKIIKSNGLPRTFKFTVTK